MKLKGAIIGCGFFAHNHMQAGNEIKNIEIVAVCDLDKKNGKSLFNMVSLIYFFSLSFSILFSVKNIIFLT